MTAALLALVLGACGGDSTAPESSPTAGVWELDAVNGAGLPFVESLPNAGADGWTITEGRLAVDGSLGRGTFLFCRRFTPPAGSTTPPHVLATTEAVAVAVSSSGVLTITYLNVGQRTGSTDTGTLSGNTLSFLRTFEIPDRTYHFQRTSTDPQTAAAGCARP
jgi:hypothetical protein